MQYTIRGVPKAVDAELRRRARQEQKSLNQVAVEALAAATGQVAGRTVRRDLSGAASIEGEDPEAAQIHNEMRRIEPTEWL
jgi:hypothetical protein